MGEVLAFSFRNSKVDSQHLSHKCRNGDELVKPRKIGCLVFFLQTSHL